MRARRFQLRSLGRLARGAGLARASPTTRASTLWAVRSRKRRPCASAVQGYLRKCGRCGMVFAVCRPCDRGRRYCGAGCAEAERAERVRGYRATQRVTFRGRRARARRNGEWRGKKMHRKRRISLCRRPRYRSKVSPRDRSRVRSTAMYSIWQGLWPNAHATQVIAMRSATETMLKATLSL